MARFGGWTLSIFACATLAVGTVYGVTPRAQPVDPQDADDALQAVEQELSDQRDRAQELEQREQALKDEIKQLSAALIKTAARIQTQQEALGETDTRLAALAEQLAALRTSLVRNRDALSGTLRALVRLNRNPPEALGLMPRTLAETTRSLRLLGKAVPTLDERGVDLARNVKKLAAVRAEIVEQRAEKSRIVEELVADRAGQSDLMARKTALQSDVAAERQLVSREIRALAARAKDLRELLEGLKKARKKARELAAAARPPRKPDPAAQTDSPEQGDNDGASDAELSLAALPSSLPYPAHGDIVETFGKGAGNAVTNKGLTIETASNAQVVAPLDGEVAYAGTFRSYGLLLIIEHGEEYHILLSGFSRIDSGEGLSLRAGEPVGVMGRRENGGTTLYMEVRRNGEPINPVTWLASMNRKVSG